MNQIFILLSLLLAVSFVSVAQNLVLNYSFEQYVPDSIDYSYGNGSVSKSEHWLNVGPGSSDYYHSDYNYVLPGRVPLNENGNQDAHSGNAYAGIYTFEIASPFNIREYIRTQLISPMIEGQVYKVSFYTSLADSSDFAAGFGINLSSVPENSFNGYLLLATEHAHTPGTIIDKQNWTLVTANYHALGGEQYITIGGFFDDNNSDTMTIGGGYPMAYYYIDDVSVSMEKLSDINSPDNLVFSLYPNPSNSTLYLQGTREISGSDIKFLDILGRQLDCNWQQAGSYLLQTDISEWPIGIYTIIIGTEVTQQRIIKL